ncbi:MBL fold metallo-hydrolase [Halobacillus salinarum]|uniref:MBL fold metallo-hydrolase n=1 Tax=Halobacillus salinarum TaxID=2932257 RepID=A0ABY4EH71_9BACI|nr:MBL fold metallo-hydrolase [Halobacillus salinarum]UOQ43408.1 MBL fold metallo-hydrolase [Halobacillus salinarum]
MSFQKINEHCYVYYGTVNIGYITKGDTGMLIDAGIDQSSIKKVLKELRSRELPLTHLFITHAHTDHYGGAAYLQEQFPLHTIAPVFEEAILANPSIEPLYLFGGNDPLPELNNKFLQGRPVRIDEVVSEEKIEAGNLSFEALLLPGHSYHQLAVRYQKILFAADAYFGVKVLRKHKIPYVTDVQSAKNSLKRLQSLECEGAVPGHGKYEEDFKSTVQANLDYHDQLLAWLHMYITEQQGGATHEQIVAAMCTAFEVKADQLSQWLLYRTAVTAYVLALLQENVITDQIDQFHWVFYPLERENK